MHAMLANWLKAHPASRKLRVAYSGGRDSHVLLHALWQLHADNPFFDLRAIHINHGLHQEASQWEKHCQDICHRYRIPLQTRALILSPAPGESIEQLAREKRYQAFASLIEQDETLLTAHRLEDQAETFLLQLMRGAGVRGLGSIAAQRSLGKGKVARPLLAVSREQIDAYAQQHALTWVEDPSNLNFRFRRNALRHQILPALAQLSPGFAQCVARSAKHCAQSQALLDEMFQADLQVCLGEQPYTLKISALKALSPLKQAFLLRYWFQHCEILSPSTKKLQTILQQMLHAKIDADPCVSWGTHQIRRYQDRLYLMPTSQNKYYEDKCSKEITWDFYSPLLLHDGTVWRAERVLGQGVSHKHIMTPLTIRFRQGGERCRVVGKKSRPLKKILQEKGIPSWQRASLPLLYQGEELVGVGDLLICEGWQVQDPGEQGWLISKVE